jgi:rhamnogalacturonan endolyase
VSTSLVLAAQVSPAALSHNSNAAVTVTDDARSFTLDNGIVKATIRKDSGSMASLIYKGVEMMGGNGGYWEQTPEGAPTLTNTVTIDPTTNNGARAEVSIKGVTGGTQMLGRGAPGGGTYCDMEIRYALGRGDSGIYVYAIFNHPASYRAGGVGSESRYITRLNQVFDWITVDKDRNMLEAAPTDWGTGVVVHAKEQRIMDKGVYKNSVEHKYSYSGVQYKTPAYGWSSTKDHIGIWFINPTIEYLSGGPTKLELDDHFGDNNNPEPIILDYWLGGHYDTGARANVAAGEEWHKVVGPIFVYVNSLDHPQTTTPSELATLAETAGNPTVPSSWTANANALWQDALAQAKKENAKWPYDWVTNADYPHAAERGRPSAARSSSMIRSRQRARRRSSLGPPRRPHRARLRQPHLDPQRQGLPVLGRRQRRRQVHPQQGPPRQLHPPRLLHRRPRRLCSGRHHRLTRQDRRPRQACLEARPGRQAALGDRLSRPHR